MRKTGIGNIARRHQHRLHSTLVAMAAGALLAAASVTASADSTENYPIPRKMLTTTCSAEQIMAAARDSEPAYYERYMTDYNNKSPEIHQAVQDRIHWFYSMNYPERRAYSESIATNIHYEHLTFVWPNWAKLFFNNKDVAAKTTAICTQYPPHDQSVWVQ